MIDNKKAFIELFLFPEINEISCMSYKLIQNQIVQAYGCRLFGVKRAYISGNIPIIEFDSDNNDDGPDGNYRYRMIARDGIISIEEDFL